MKNLFVKIARGNENYGAWIDNLPGVYGQGDTVEEAKTSLEESLTLYVRHNAELPDVIRGEYQLEYHFDIPSFLEYYSGIFSKPALERLTGINRKQLFHYASGLRKPSERTAKKLDDAIHRFASELSQVRFV
jgi:predicted RNase H-like HicB family nuclease